MLKAIKFKTTRLINGSGSEKSGACWMSAIKFYVENKDWSDQPECVCPLIRRLCIGVNDSLPSNEARDRVIVQNVIDGRSVLLWPVGTATDDKKINEARLWTIVDAAVRRFAPAAMRFAKQEDWAVKLESLPVVTRENAKASENLCREARDAAAADAAAAYAAYAAAAADAAAAAYAAYAAAGAAAAAAAAADDDAADDAAAAAYAAYAAAARLRARNEARESYLRDHVVPLIIELCKVGRREVKPVRPIADLKRILCGV